MGISLEDFQAILIDPAAADQFIGQLSGQFQALMDEGSSLRAEYRDLRAEVSRLEDAMDSLPVPDPRSEPPPASLLPPDAIGVAASPDPRPDPSSLPPDQGRAVMQRKRRRSRRK